MRHRIETGVRRLGGAVFWGVALLVLPNCSFGSPPGSPGPNLYKGSQPRSGAIFCDIEKGLGRHCATASDLAVGIPLTEAAVALNTGATSNIGLDYSADALARCSGGPEAVLFEGPFPEGFPVCVNCGEVIGTASYPDVDAACRAQCYDFYGTTEADGTFTPDRPPDPNVKAFCDAQAKASTNMPLNSCLEDACPAAGGTLNGDFNDPRRTPDVVEWQDLVGTSTVPGGTLTRTAPTTSAYDAGAVSTQWITRGDGYLEFGPGTNTQQHVIGLSQIPAGCAFPCADTSQNYNTIGYAFVLGFDGRIYISIGGAFVIGPGVNGSFGTYTALDRFRVSVTANQDGTAAIAFGKVIGTCTPGMPCNVLLLHQENGDPALGFPLRVDTSFLDQGSMLTNVRMVYIK